MIEIKFAAATPAALRALIGEYLGQVGVEAVPAGKPAKTKAEPPAETAKANVTVAVSDVAAATSTAAAPTAAAPAAGAVTYDQIAAAVPKTAGLGPNAAAKCKALMVKWGVVPPKKVRDAVPAEKYGEFLTELLAITNE